jgi:polysaccharide export outer membrane protein
MTLTIGMRRCTALLLSFALVSACARNRYPQAPTTPFDDPSFSAPETVVPSGMESDPPEALRLFPGDVVQLTTVSARTETYEGLIVDAKGQLHVPLAGDIQVGGLTLGDAELAIERGLRRYDRFVRVNLIITTLDGHSAVVIGAVTTPGRVKISPGTRLADLLAQAGGVLIGRVEYIPERLGDLELARLVRDGEALPVSLPLAMEGDSKHNIRVRAGDQLYVPPITKNALMVLGEVGRPQPMAYRKGIRLTEALARAGGINMARADRKDIRIIRGPLTEPRVYTTNLKALTSGEATDVVLWPGDIIWVTKSWYASTADVMNGLSQIISLANTAAILALAYGVGGTAR